MGGFFYLYFMNDSILNTSNQNEFRRLMGSSFKFRLALLKMLPLASVIGLKLKKLDEEKCTLTVPYKWLNKNPFGTTYWAVMGMVSEMASGLLLLMYTYKIKPSVSTFVVGCEAKFHKRAVGITTFKCDQGLEIAKLVEETCRDFQAKEIRCVANGYDESGDLVAEFVFIWGLKARSPKK